VADTGRGRRARLDQPFVPRRSPLASYDPESFGEATETIARFLGTGRYLVIQSAIIVAWMVYNALPGVPHFDPFPYLFLTLALSLQAAYSAPLILLAQNRQDDRDRVNLADDRAQVAQTRSDIEYLARELAAIRLAIGEVATRDFLRSELSRLAETPRGPRSGGGKKKRPPADPEVGSPTADPSEPVNSSDQIRGHSE
jgi:uncharacterized membrane protein